MYNILKYLQANVCLCSLSLSVLYFYFYTLTLKKNKEEKKIKRNKVRENQKNFFGHFCFDTLSSSAPAYPSLPLDSFHTFVTYIANNVITTKADMSSVPTLAGLSRFWPYCPAQRDNVPTEDSLSYISGFKFFKSDQTEVTFFFKLKHNFPKVDGVVSLSTLHCESRDHLVLGLLTPASMK